MAYVNVRSTGEDPPLDLVIGVPTLGFVFTDPHTAQIMKIKVFLFFFFRYMDLATVFFFFYDHTTIS